MLPAILAVLRVYSPYIVFPFAVIIGTIGYNLESILGDRQIGGKTVKESISKERSERMLNNMDTTDATQVESLKKKSFVPQSVLDRNMSATFIHQSQLNDN